MSTHERATAIAATLGRLGRPATADDITPALEGMDGLPDADADRVVLATYGVSGDGTPTADFTPPRTQRQSLGHALAGAGGALAYVGVAALAGIVPGLAVPLMVRAFVDRYLVADDPSWLWRVAIGIVIAALLMAVVSYLQLRVLNKVAVRINAAATSGFAWHVLRLPTATISRLGAGSLAGRISALQSSGLQVGLMLPLAGVNVVTVVAFATALLVIDWSLGVAAIVICILAALATTAFRRRQVVIERAHNAAQVALSDATSDIVTGIESVKAPAWEQPVFTRWAMTRAEAARWTSVNGRMRQYLSVIPLLTPTLGFGVVLAIGALQVIAGSLTLGTLVAAQSFLAILLGAAAELVWIGVLVNAGVARLEQAHEVECLPLDPEVVAPDEVAGAAGAELGGELQGVGLVFGFDRSQPPLVDGVDIRVPAGSRVALVGSSGSGKTTIARLLLGEIQPWAGTVLLDGVPRLAVPRSTRTRGIAYVPQQSVLFPGTIRDNLTLWDDAITDDDIRQAVADACIGDAIAERPGGLDAVLTGQGGGLSGGEVQRLAIARALAGNPRILVLDEATSALDPVVEAEVEANLRRRGCTCVVVAHRLSTIRDADEILVVKHGHITHRGTFDEVLAAGALGAMVHG